MQRLAWIPVLLGCLLAGCGGGDGTAGSLDAALSYLPRDTPFAVAVDTDLEGEQWRAVDSILERFPIGGDAEDLLRRKLDGQGVDFRRDVEPVLGNPLVISAGSPRSFRPRGEDDFVAAIEADDPDALDALIDRMNPRKEDEVAGTTIYRDGGTLFAVEDEVVVFADSRALIEQALERADGDDHLDRKRFAEGLQGLPDGSLVDVYANVEALLRSDPAARAARRVEWLGALRTLGLTASVAEDRIDVEFNLRTDAEGLSDEDLPIAAGDQAPPVVENRGEVGFGIRDPAQIVRFAETVARAVDPASFGRYAQAKRTLGARLGIDIDDDLIGAFSGDVSGSVALDGGFGLRAELEDPGAFRRTLAKAAPALPALLRRAGAGRARLERPRSANGLYVLRRPGGDADVFGVVDGVFVVAGDRARAVRLAGERPVSVPDAEGAVVIGADAEQLANEILHGLVPGLGLRGLGGLGGLFTGALGDLSGWMAADADGLRGRLRLELE